MPGLSEYAIYVAPNAIVHLENYQPQHILLLSGKDILVGDTLTHRISKERHTVVRWEDTMIVTRYENEIGPAEDWTESTLYYFKEQILASSEQIKDVPTFRKEDLELICDLLERGINEVVVDYIAEETEDGWNPDVLVLNLTEHNEVICSLYKDGNGDCNTCCSWYHRNHTCTNPENTRNNRCRWDGFLNKNSLWSPIPEVSLEAAARSHIPELAHIVNTVSKLRQMAIDFALSNDVREYWYNKFKSEY